MVTLEGSAIALCSTFPGSGIELRILLRSSTRVTSVVHLLEPREAPFEAAAFAPWA